MIRQKKYIMNNIIELEMFNPPKRAKQIIRAKRATDSRPAQRNLNSKNSRKYFNRLIHCNFTEKDYKLTLTFKTEELPNSKEEARKKLKNFLARTKRFLKKRGLEDLKYIYVLSNDDNLGNKVRYHVHLIINGIEGLSDKDITNLWGHGYTHMNNLQFDEHGVSGLATYMANQSKGAKSWGSSIGLKKPEAIISDKAINNKTKQYIENNPDDRMFIQKMYPGYGVSLVEVSQPTLIHDDGEIIELNTSSILIRLYKLKEH